MNDKDSLNDMSLVLKKRYKSLFKEYKSRYLKENNINIKSVKKEIKTSTMVFTLGLILLYFQENIIYLLFSSKDNQTFPIIVIFLLIREAFKIFNKSILYFNNEKRLSSIDKKFLPYYYSKRDLKFKSDEVRYLKKIIE